MDYYKKYMKYKMLYLNLQSKVRDNHFNNLDILSMKYKNKYLALLNIYNSLLDTVNKNLKNQHGSSIEEDVNKFKSSPSATMANLNKLIETGILEFTGNNYDNSINYKYLLSTMNPDKLIDNNIYTSLKFTILKQGTILYHRQMEQFYPPPLMKPDGIPPIIPFWCDYTGRIDSITNQPVGHSFLLDPSVPPLDINYPIELQRKYYDKTVNHFGKYLLKSKVNKDLFIIHFPIDYGNLYGNSIPSTFESIIKYFCVPSYDIPYSESYCVDGYTLDFFTLAPISIYYGLSDMHGYREICILDKTNLTPLECIKIPS